MPDFSNNFIDCHYPATGSTLSDCASGRSHDALTGDVSFQSLLVEKQSSPSSEPVRPPAAPLPRDLPVEMAASAFVASRHPQHPYQGIAPSTDLSDWEKYKDDQLLSNPGGDAYDFRGKRVIPEPQTPPPFWDRVGKDLSDAFDNLKNAFHHLLFGADFLYRDEHHQIQEASHVGLLGSVGEFFKDLASAFSLGAWRPDGEDAPDGLGDRAAFFFKKMKEAIFGDLVQGVGGSAARSGESLILAGWNLLEVVPDATIGNFEEGAKLTTTIFDNGQVAIDYLTDVIPTGEAWLRVHSPNLDDLGNVKLPVIYNIQLPERYGEDARWRYVRNTPFRKTIETIGSLLADVATVKVLGDTSFSSEGKKD
jgi:hypothetical protein